MRYLSAVLASALFWTSSASAAPSLKALWRARALDASERLQKLVKQLETVKGKEAERDVRAEIMVEAAYAIQLDPKLSSLAYRAQKGGFESFRIVMNGGGEANLLLIVFLYERGRLVATKIESVPKSWNVSLLTEMPGKLVVMAPDLPSIVIDLQDPLGTQALTSRVRSKVPSDDDETGAYE